MFLSGWISSLTLLFAQMTKVTVLCRQKCVGRGPHSVNSILSVIENGKLFQNLFGMIKCETLDFLCKTLCSVKLEYFYEDTDDHIKCVICLFKVF